eukprot:EG_transcript_4550
MSCCSPFTCSRRRHLCRGCLKTICVSCLGTTVSFFTSPNAALCCRDCLLFPAPLLDADPSPNVKVRGRTCSEKAVKRLTNVTRSHHPDDSVNPFATAVPDIVFPRSAHWAHLVATHAAWPDPGPPAAHRRFLRGLADHPTAAAHEYLLGLCRAPGNPLFATMQAFAWEIQDLNRYWRDHGPRRALMNAKADMAAFRRCAFHPLHVALFDGISQPAVLEALRRVLDKEVQSRAHPVLRDVLRALHAPKDRRLNALAESPAAAEAYEAIPGEQRVDFSAVTRVLQQVSLCTDAEAKLRKVLEAIRLVHATLDEAARPRPASPFPGPVSVAAMPPHHGNQHVVPNGDPCDALRPTFPVSAYSGADSMMPVFIHCILKAAVPCVWAELEFIREFLVEQQHAGPLGYTLCTLEAALCWILDRFAGQEIQGAADECDIAEKDALDLEIEALKEAL